MSAAPRPWFYRDSEGTVQGPFDASQMRVWFDNEWFDVDLPLSRRASDEFLPLGRLFTSPEDAFTVESFPATTSSRAFPDIRVNLSHRMVCECAKQIVIKFLSLITARKVMLFLFVLWGALMLVSIYHVLQLVQTLHSQHFLTLNPRIDGVHTQNNFHYVFNDTVDSDKQEWKRANAIKAVTGHTHHRKVPAKYLILTNNNNTQPATLSPLTNDSQTPIYHKFVTRHVVAKYPTQPHDGLLMPAVLWDDERCMSIMNHSQKILFLGTSLGAYKADICRLVVLYMFGGVYTDDDVVLLTEAVNPGVLTVVKETSIFKDSFDQIGIMQAFLTSPPGHPVLRTALEIMWNSREGTEAFENLFNGSITLYGPWCLQRALGEYKGQYTLLQEECANDNPCSCGVPGLFNSHRLGSRYCPIDG